ncbi:hypothetical protein HGM15179_011003 [Zosterops borbonicus]|uniref:Uncharacterized protein n=1 Tax=Zosterops borbonicus TaxID=364589 RepID=A0A8K1LJ77_9PASS|nr:hypothetical protein HGM15179_011003 [Zosterops borbonicus]
MDFMILKVPYDPNYSVILYVLLGTAQGEVWGQLVTSGNSEERAQVVSGGGIGQDKMGEDGMTAKEGTFNSTNSTCREKTHARNPMGSQLLHKLFSPPFLEMKKGSHHVCLLAMWEVSPILLLRDNKEQVCDHKDCHCDFAWTPLDCKLEEFEGSAESGAPPPLQSQHNLVGPLCTPHCLSQLHFSSKFPIYTFGPL